MKSTKQTQIKTLKRMINLSTITRKHVLESNLEWNKEQEQNYQQAILDLKTMIKQINK